MATEAIYHLALAADWDPTAAEYRTSTIGRTLDEVGFIHCSTAGQVQQTADLFYRGRDDVVLLEIDPDRLGCPVRFEEVPGGQRFPHVYGPIPIAAVVSVRKLETKGPEAGPVPGG